MVNVTDLKWVRTHENSCCYDVTQEILHVVEMASDENCGDSHETLGSGTVNEHEIENDVVEYESENDVVYDHDHDHDHDLDQVNENDVECESENEASVMDLNLHQVESELWQYR